MSSRPLRFFGAVLVGLLGMMAISFMQKKFDDADLRKAEQAIRLRFPQVTECHSSVESRFRGWVRVVCGEKSWRVDVTRGFIEAIDRP